MTQTISSLLPDRDLMLDCLSSEKLITGMYNSGANECASASLRTEMLNLLREEHNLQSTVFTELQKRGWYSTPVADNSKVQTARQKYTSG